MLTFKQFIAEMAAPRLEDKAKVYYHGTSKEVSISGIMKHGINPPDLTLTKKHNLTPVEGKVYITPDLRYAIIYCIGGDMLGSKWYDPEFKRNERYGYLVVIDGNNIKDIQPDEDGIGELIYNKKAPSWLMNLANRKLTTTTLRRMADGEYEYFAKAGKILVQLMTDEQKLEIISLGTHIAHTGNIGYKEIWKFDKAKTEQLEKDGSNFFTLAEKIKG
jgi:hypothetical protein